MANPIKRKDLYEGGNPFLEVAEGIKEYLTLAARAKKASQELAAEMLNASKVQSPNTKQGQQGITEQSKEIAKLEAEVKRLTGAMDALTKEYDKLTASGKRYENQTKKLTDEQKLALKIEALKAKETTALAGSYAQLSARLSRLLAEQKNFTAIGSEQWKKYNKEIADVNKTLKEADASHGTFGRNVGNYEGALGRLKAGWLGITAGVAAVVAAGHKFIEFGEEAIKLAMDEEKAEARLRLALDGNEEAMQRMTRVRNKMFHTTLFSKDEINNALNYALSLGRSEEQTNKLMQAAAGLARVEGTDLQSALTKLQGTYEGVKGRLARYAGEIKTMTTEQLKAGDAVDLIAEKLGKFGSEGLDTSTGKIVMAKKAWEEFTEHLGMKVLPVLGELLTIFNAKVIGSESAKEQLLKQQISATEQLIALDAKRGADIPARKEKLDMLKYELSMLQQQAAFQERIDKINRTKAGNEKALKAGPQYYPVSAERDKELFKQQEDAAKEAAKVRKQQEEEARKNMIAAAEEQGKMYEQALKEQEKLEQDYYKMRVDLGVASQDEIIQNEMDAAMKSAEFRLLLEKGTAEEIAKAREEIYQRALKKSAGGTASGEDGVDMSGAPMPAYLKDPIKAIDGNKGWQSWLQENLKYVEAFASAAQKILGGVSEAMKINQQKELDASEQKYTREEEMLQKQLDSKAISNEQYNLKKAQLDKKRAAEEERIRREYAKKQKQIAIIQAIINTALGVTQALAQEGPIGIITGALVALAGAYEISIISGQEFEKGGHGKLGKEGMRLRGKRHRQGGISLGELGTAEDGEYFGVINRGATERYKDDLPLIFDALNSQRFESMFRPNTVNVKVDAPYNRQIYQELAKPKPQQSVLTTEQFIIIQTGNYTQRVRR